MFGDEEIYISKIGPKDREVFDRLTTPRHWDSACFRQVLVAMGSLAVGTSVPARNRPDGIHIQDWRRDIDDLARMTKENGREHARAVFADLGKQTIVFSGRTTVGSESKGRIDATKQPGRERYQRIIASIHMHPSNNPLDALTVHGLSGCDYRTFLGDPRQQAMLIGYGENNLMMVLKTSATPNNLSNEMIDRRIQAIEQEFLENSREHVLLRVVNFNKAVCMELGLTMYTADKKSRDQLTRVEVTR